MRTRPTPLARRCCPGWVSQGPQVAAFEREFAALVDAPFACAVSNCTTALHLALMAIDIAPGDEVITASHSFIATANCIRYCGATPVFVDIDPETYNIDPARVAEAITPRTRAILAIHQMGMPCDLARIGRPGEAPRPHSDRRRCLRRRQPRSASTNNGIGSASPTATSPASHSIPAR